MVKSMSGQLSMFDLTTCEDSSSVTSLPASVDGVTRSDSPDGLTIEKYGADHLHVFRIPAPPEVGASLRTCGLHSDDSSQRVALQSLLESRLTRLGLGWMASALTWRHWDTPSGRRFSRLTVSVKTMHANGFTLRATPTSTANQSAPSMQKHPGCRGLVVTPETWCQRMGYPAEWLACAPLETPSSRKSARPSSKAISQQRSDSSDD